MTLLETQSNIMKTISSGNKNFNFLLGASACAQALKLSHLIELIETQTLYTANNYIQSIFQQAKENKSKAVKQIIKNPDFEYPSEGNYNVCLTVKNNQNISTIPISQFFPQQISTLKT